MDREKKKLIGFTAAGFLAGLVFCLGIICFLVFGIGRGPVVLTNDSYDYYRQLDQRFNKVNALYDEVLTNYYMDFDHQDLEDGMCKGLINGLGDAYSVYMTEEEYNDWQETLSGKFEGIGITFSTDEDGQYVIISTFDGAPAEEAGLKAGDLILEVDGETYDSMDEVSTAIKGEAGTYVTITYSRNGAVNEVKVQRAEITNVSVESEILDDNIGYIALSAFEEETAEEFEKALTEMEKKKVKGIIVDLRDNGGGLLDEGTEIADMLLGDGTVISMQGKSGNEDVVTSDPEKTDIPLVILINENSASTAEVLAVAIKDNTDYPLVGTTTFGKGIIQMSGQFQDGSALKLTTMQYFSPDGNVIHKKGVTPDIKVENTETEDKQLKKAIELLK